MNYSAAEHIADAQRLLRVASAALHVMGLYDIAAGIEAADLRLTQAIHAIQRGALPHA